jgi:uncharacterized protein DUF4190
MYENGQQDYYPPAPYPQQPYYAPKRETEGLAIASLVVSIHGFGCPLIGVVGAILGHMARRRIQERGTEGAGLALAGIIIGWVATGLTALFIAFYIIFFVVLVSTGTTTS